ncbi:proline-rich protein 14 isoform X2 [Hyperolius riggenbachi]|uniref:proline-rich protein 14 isoform X2 n=1 Tax=Hyperolius riggenbachi TaxID=752182 RepID=UPI0035A2F24B
MSRDAEERRHRRRLFIYRPSATELPITSNVQQKEISKRLEPSLRTSPRHRRNLHQPSSDSLQTSSFRHRKNKLPPTEPQIKNSFSTHQNVLQSPSPPKHLRSLPLPTDPQLQTTPSKPQTNQSHLSERSLRSSPRIQRNLPHSPELPLQTSPPRDWSNQSHSSEPPLRPSLRSWKIPLQSADPLLQTSPSRHRHNEYLPSEPSLKTSPRDRRKLSQSPDPPLQTSPTKPQTNQSHLSEPSLRSSPRIQRNLPLQTSPSRHENNRAHLSKTSLRTSRDQRNLSHSPGPSPQTSPSRRQNNESHLSEPSLRTSPRDWRNLSWAPEPQLQTFSSLDLRNDPQLQNSRPKDCEHVPQAPQPLHTTPSKPHIKITPVSPLQTTPSKRQMAQEESLQTPLCCEQSLYVAATPFEKTNRILSVQLSDMAHQVPQRDMTPEKGDRPDVGGAGDACSGLVRHCDYLDVSILPSPSREVPPEPQPPPAKLPRWGLGPLFNSVRTKLESFAEIFLSPAKSQPEPQGFANDSNLVVEQTQPCCCPIRETPTEADGSQPLDHATQDSSGSQPCSPSREETEKDQPSLTPPSNTDVNFQLKIQISSPVSSLCRPPLERCLSCPLVPKRLRRLSLDTEERSAATCSPRAEISRKRRHSMGTLEECRKLRLSPISFTCLRKEKHPFALGLASSPAGNGLDEERERDREIPVEGDGGAVNPPSHSQGQEVKERKVSNIQIRKRVTKQEGSLTPMGLPKRIRLQKEDFSLEEIYTNKNYHTPTEKRKFETIFEEPVMKGDALILTSQRPLRRCMVFKDSSVPRRGKKKGRGASRTRSCANTKKGTVNIELLLQHKLDQLEAALKQQEEMDSF